MAKFSFPDGLAAAVKGPVLAAGDPRVIEETAGFVLTVHDPAVVVCAADAGDIAASVRWASGQGLPVAVQATGHGAVTPVRGDAMLISTRRMNKVIVDPRTKTATLEPGVCWGPVIEAAAPHGLAPLNGSSPLVGATGYVTGGGLPLLGRAFGFAADNVRSFELITADGQLRGIDPDSEPDLFWAVRGGKGSFGIVTSMTVDLMPVTRIYGGAIYYPGEAAPAVFHAYREWTSTLSDETTTSLALLRLPPMPGVPLPLAGRLTVGLRVAHIDDAGNGAKMLAPMRAAAPTLIDTVGDMPYTKCAEIYNDPAEPLPVWEAGSTLRELNAATVDRLMEVAGPGIDTPMVMIETRHLGGALARQPAVPNAVAGRDAAFTFWMLGVLESPDADMVPVSAAAIFNAMAPWSTGQAVLNLLGFPVTPERVAAAWPRETLTRLQTIKSRVDSANTFRFGHCVPPAG